jgi:hypothetical protein
VDTHIKLYNYKTVKECNNIPTLYTLKGEREIEEKESGVVVRGAGGKKRVSPV